MASTNERINLIAIPPEAKQARMSVLVHTGDGIFFNGPGNIDWHCGRCGRVLAVNQAPHSMENLWLTCQDCGWLNGLDMDLGWAEYVMKALLRRKLSLKRIQEIAKDAQDVGLSDEEFADRTADAGPALLWLRKISVPLLVMVLTLLVGVYYNQRELDVSEKALQVAEQAAHSTGKRSPTRRQAKPADVQRLVRELHRLQREIRLQSGG